jgi:hypothetical protein
MAIRDAGKIKRGLQLGCGAVLLCMSVEHIAQKVRRRAASIGGERPQLSRKR